MKPKIWGDNPAAQAIGESKLRQLKQLGVPYLSASGPGFMARKRGIFSEVVLDAAQPNEPTHGDQYAVIGMSDYSFAGARLNSTFKKKAAWTGEYIGRGMTSTYAPPQIRIVGRYSSAYPMYVSEKPGMVFVEKIYKTGTREGFYVQSDTRTIPRAQFPWEITQGKYDTPPASTPGWGQSGNVRGTFYPAHWDGRPVFAGWIGGAKVFAVPNIVWDGSGDRNGHPLGKAVVDVYINLPDSDILEYTRVELQTPGGTADANGVTGTITVLRPGVFVVLVGQSLLNIGVGENGHDVTDGQISLWHNVVSITKEAGDDWAVGIQAYRLREVPDTVWSTSDYRYSKEQFIQRAARVVSQSPSVLCAEGDAILYAISSPYYERMDDEVESITRGSRDFGVAYVKVGVDGAILSGTITTPEILKARRIDESINRDKASGAMPACDLIYCGAQVILARVREFVSQLPTADYSGGSVRWPMVNSPPLPSLNRVEMWRSEDDGASWTKLPDSNGLPQKLNISNVGIPSVVSLGRKNSVGMVALPVRDISGNVSIATSRNGGISWETGKVSYEAGNYSPGGVFNGGAGVDVFSLRSGGFCNNLDAPYLFNGASEVLYGRPGDAPTITMIIRGYEFFSESVEVINSLYPAADKSFKEVVRVRVDGKHAPKDLIRPWIYDTAYKESAGWLEY